MTIYLYVKTHRVTGLKYLGKTIRDPYTYNGSGLYWKRHLKEHGTDLETQVLLATEDKDEFKETALFFSKIFNIVSSKEWANFREETGHGGFSKEAAYRGYINGQHKRSLTGGQGAVKAGKVWNSETAKEVGRKGGLANKGQKRASLSEERKEHLREIWRKKKSGSLV